MKTNNNNTNSRSMSVGENTNQGARRVRDGVSRKVPTPKEAMGKARVKDAKLNNPEAYPEA